MYIDKSMMHKKVIEHLMGDMTIAGQEARLQWVGCDFRFKYYFPLDERNARLSEKCEAYRRVSEERS